MNAEVNNSNFFFRNRKQLSNIKRIFCGFSGGADSTALLILLKKESAKVGFKLKAVHFQHGLRGKESSEDAVWCAKFCKDRNIEFIEISLNLKSSMKGKESFEDLARGARLKEWKILCSEEGDAVALGHNSDDRNENMIIRLIRGSNVSGLSSLREIQKINGITIIRPLLNYSRAQIVNFLSDEHVSKWREDSSNSNDKLLRNYIRNKVIVGLTDICQGARDGMKKAAEALLDDAIFIENEVDKYWKRMSHGASKLESLPLRVFKKLSKSIKIRILRRWISSIIERDYIPNDELLSRIDSAIARIAKLKNKNRLKIQLPSLNENFIVVKKTEISFAKIAKSPKSIEWNWKKNPTIHWGKWIIKSEEIITKDKNFRSDNEYSAFFLKAVLSQVLIIGPALEEDKMIPFGSDKDVRLKKIFENKKISSDEKLHYPVFRIPENGRIIWIGGVRRSNFALAKAGQELLKITICRFAK